MLPNEFEIFKELNVRLKAADINLSVICVGGFVLSHYGMRATQDIDGFYETSDRIESIIHDIGEKYGINTAYEPWLNNSVQDVNRTPPDDICDTIYLFSNLTVMMPPLEYIAGMKLESARIQDVQDVAGIIIKRQMSSPDHLAELLESYGFSSIDESLLLEAFGMAYGMDWLEQYFIENEEEINRRILGR